MADFGSVEEHIEYCRGIGMDDEEIAYAVMAALANAEEYLADAHLSIQLTAAALVSEYDLDEDAVHDAHAELIGYFN